MKNPAIYTVLCDIDKTTTGTMPDPNTLPTGWMNLAGSLFGDAGPGTNNIDVCPTCLAQLSDLPEPWQALIPTPPSGGDSGEEHSPELVT